MKSSADVAGANLNVKITFMNENVHCLLNVWRELVAEQQEELKRTHVAQNKAICTRIRDILCLRQYGLKTLREIMFHFEPNLIHHKNAE